MAPRIIDCEQGSQEWLAARAGLPTASEFHSILAKGEGKMRRAYLLRLTGEIITGQPAETFSNSHMERGKAMEDEARDAYAFVADVEPERVGFIVNDALGVGYSPDSLIGANGLLEIKTKLPHLMVDLLLKDEFPPEHRAQCQGGLWVSEREWIDLVCYWPGMPKFVKRVKRDENYIATLSTEVERFKADLAEIVERIRNYGAREAT